MKTGLEQLIEILEAKRDVAIWADVSPLEILDSCILEAKDLAKVPEGTWTKIKLRSGKFFDFANPSVEDITIEDIARGLATEYRYGGQTPEPYSVAQHAFYCSQEPGTYVEQFERLHHDDSESLMKDMPKPLKNLLVDYQVIEEKVTMVINQKLNIGYPFTDSCHEVDKRIFDWEYKGMMLGQYEIEVWDVKTAEQMWLDRHYYLLNKIEDELRQVEAGEA